MNVGRGESNVSRECISARVVGRYDVRGRVAWVGVAASRLRGGGRTGRSSVCVFRSDENLDRGAMGGKRWTGGSGDGVGDKAECVDAADAHAGVCVDNALRFATGWMCGGRLEIVVDGR